MKYCNFKGNVDLLLLLGQLTVHWPAQRWGPRLGLLLVLVLVLVLLALLALRLVLLRLRMCRRCSKRGLVGVRLRVPLRPRPLLSALFMHLLLLPHGVLSLQRIRHRLQRVSFRLCAHQHVFGSVGAMLRAHELSAGRVELAPKALDDILLLAEDGRVGVVVRCCTLLYVVGRLVRSFVGAPFAVSFMI